MIDEEEDGEGLIRYIEVILEGYRAICPELPLEDQEE
jgi:hypothetical protein